MGMACLFAAEPTPGFCDSLSECHAAPVVAGVELTEESSFCFLTKVIKVANRGDIIRAAHDHFLSRSVTTIRSHMFIA